MRLLVASAAVALFGLVPAFAAPVNDPCRYRGPAVQLELSAYTRYGWIESYLIYTNDRGQMMTTWGRVNGWIRSRPFGENYWSRRDVFREVNFDCQEFQWFTRGIASETVIAYVLPKVQAPAAQGMLYELCIRHWATYMPGKEVCDSF